MKRYTPVQYKYFKNNLYRILETISIYHPDCAPCKNDVCTDLLEKYFYWVTEYNDGHMPSENYTEPFSTWLRTLFNTGLWN